MSAIAVEANVFVVISADTEVVEDQDSRHMFPQQTSNHTPGVYSFTYTVCTTTLNIPPKYTVHTYVGEIERERKNMKGPSAVIKNGNSNRK